jgi:hypothetical protein
MEMVCNPNKKGGLSSRLRLRGKDLNLRPLGYEGKIGGHANTHQHTTSRNSEGFRGFALGSFWLLLAGVPAQNPHTVILIYMQPSHPAGLLG